MSAVDRGRSAIEDPARKARQDADAGRGWYAVLARTGIVAKGISFALVGALAIKVAIGHGGKATSRQGALQSIAHHSFGKIVLVALALGFAAYALWRFVQAFAERPDSQDGEGKVWAKRAGYVGRGLIYAGLTYSTIRIVAGAGGGQSQNSKAHKSTAMVLGWTGGRWLVGAAGLVVIGVGVWNLYRGLTRKFEDKWRVQRLGHTARVWGGRAGVLGHVARFEPSDGPARPPGAEELAAGPEHDRGDQDDRHDSPGVAELRRPAGRGPPRRQASGRDRGVVESGRAGGQQDRDDSPQRHWARPRPASASLTRPTAGVWGTWPGRPGASRPGRGRRGSPR